MHTIPTTFDDIPRNILDEFLEHFDSYDTSPFIASDDFDLDEGDLDWRITYDPTVYSDYSLADDGDWYGLVEHARNNRDTGRAERPSHFNGSARIIDREPYGATWWQPPTDLKNINDPKVKDTLDKIESTLKDILNYGYKCIQVTVEYKCPCCNTWSTLTDAWLDGLAPFDDPDKSDIGDIIHTSLYQ